MAKAQVKDLLEAGVHFGHMTRKWNPNMAPYIFMEKNGIHIIDLHKTAVKLDEACNALEKITSAGKKVLFVATKKQAKEVVAKCKEAGVVLTGAGSAYPYKKDPDDRNIRLAPTFPPLEDLKKAAEVFILCVKLVSVNKLLSDKEA